MEKYIIDIDVRMFDAFGYELFERIEDQINNNWHIVIKDSDGKVLKKVNTLEDLEDLKKQIKIKPNEL